MLYRRESVMTLMVFFFLWRNITISSIYFARVWKKEKKTPGVGGTPSL